MDKETTLPNLKGSIGNYKWEIIKKDNPIGLMLGYATDCCQVIGGDGESCLKTGYEEVEVNNRGRVIRQLHEQPPSAGKDVYLTLDLNLQRYIEQLLVGSRAAVVVSDPRTGGILAMVSNPSYDPNLFVDGISSKDYQGLQGTALGNVVPALSGRFDKNDYVLLHIP